MPQTVCNPVAAAELVGREYLLQQLPSRDSYRTRQVIDRIYNINESANGIEDSLNRVQALHGPYNGASTELASFAKNLFGDDPVFRAGILEIEQGLIEAQQLFRNVEGLIDDVSNLTFSDVSTALMRGYLRQVEILLPSSVKDAIQADLERFPLFTKMSEGLGMLYENFVINDGATNLIDGIIQSALDESGLSSVLNQHDWYRTIPEYAINFHDNVRLFQRLGTRVLPKCTYGKIYNIMDEPLAHIYNLAHDVLGFIDIFENRRKYLSLLFGQYRDLIRKINNLYPVCHEYSVTNDVQSIVVGDGTVDVDILGKAANPVQATGAKGRLIRVEVQK